MAAALRVEFDRDRGIRVTRALAAHGHDRVVVHDAGARGLLDANGCEAQHRWGAWREVLTPHQGGRVKGIVFNLLEEVVTAHVGETAWDRVLAQAGADGAYTSLGNYPDGDFAKLIGVLARASRKTDRQVLAWFGRHAMPFLAQRYPEFFSGQRGLRGFLLSLNDVIHAEVRKLYPGADVPEFEFETPAGDAALDTLVIHYRSKRRLCALAEGFIAGAADHFREDVAVSQQACMLDGAPECIIKCRFEGRGAP